MILHLDFESFSDVDLTKVGVYTYSRARNTDLWMAAWAFDDEPAKLWHPPEPLPQRIFDHIESGGQVWAHSAEFEQEMCNNIATRKYGWPHVYTEQLFCTKAMAYAMALPASLEKAAAALGITHQKDMEGKRLMLQMCQPRATDSIGKHTWWNEPDKIARLGQYCLKDLEVERELGHRMLRLSHFEKKVWELDQKINSRGIKVDLKAVTSALAIVQAEKQRLIGDMQRESSNTIASPQAIAQIKSFLELHNVEGVESLDKAGAREILERPGLPEACRRVLEIRREAGKTSTAKLQAMLEGASPGDARVRGGFQYSGAHTRRWAGRRLQFQNLPRTKINAALVNDILTEIPQLTADKMRLFYGEPLDVISNCLRGCLVAEDGHEFIVADFAAIEARVIAWLAGQESVLEVFRGHGKVYEHTAAEIFGKNIMDVTGDQRQVGKVAVLALGFQGGVGALQNMCKAYGVSLEPAYQVLWGRATHDQKDFVEKRYDENRKDYPELSREEFIASDLVKTFWRIANPQIVRFWAGLEDAAIGAVKTGTMWHVRNAAAFKKAGSFLFCKLASGGVVSYPYPQVEQVKMPWGDSREALTYMAEDINHKWTRHKTYGGSLAENVTQSFARDLLADAMLRLEVRGFKVVAHAHDEIICEQPVGEKTVQDMSNIMSETPVWAGGLPINATGYTAKRYRKG